MRYILSFLLVLAFHIGAARAQEPMLLPLHPDPLVAETANGEKRFAIEIADTDEKRARGLMFRQSMSDDHGMLFVFEKSRRLGFWMQNTPMPLDLLFIGEDGKVRAIEEGEPFSTDSIAPPVAAQFVLELKAGTAQKAGIEIGDRLRHPLIDAVASDN
ncbi:DUF192 domain-containing protein [Chelativorans salis]|uniref:DUF192 domain-containing protein n=1 Tax=Chelativorans salis TaxID=2978478 RepID=A0ABT2LLK7_9HYPH|nr:DUF192 domain-containing protein [Chelativorans sp. EGI FJ00035]MCT7375450.1 DUF192 domain-containing protein [Chelativorans sp. EGI FJ00035]